MRVPFLKQITGRLPAVTARLMLLLGPLGLAGCGGEQVPTYEPISDPAQLYMRLTLNHVAITMATVAPYDTLQLIATPRDAAGAPMDGLPAPTFHTATTADTLLVKVSPEGLLTARQPATGVMVIAELQAPGNVRHADTALVNVTSAPPAALPARLTMDIVAPDSAIWSVPFPFQYPDSTLTLAAFYDYIALLNFQTRYDLAPRVRVLDAAQNPIAPLPIIKYHSLDPDVIKLGSLVATTPPRWDGMALPLRAGQARLVAQATVYGDTLADTLTITITPPEFSAVAVESSSGTTPRFVFGDQTIRPNGVVMWLNALDRPAEVVFDNPTGIMPAPAALCNLVASVLNSILSAYGIPGTYTGVPCPATGGSLTLPQPAAATRGEIWKTVQMLQFTQAGTYTYHDSQTGVSGRIVVTEVGGK